MVKFTIELKDVPTGEALGHITIENHHTFQVVPGGKPLDLTVDFAVAVEKFAQDIVRQMKDATYRIVAE